MLEKVTPPALNAITVRYLGQTEYVTTWQAMQAFTHSRTADTPDELWITEHPPVYTLGLNRKHVRNPSRTDIPVIPVDRGGKITYHGPGQLIVYLLLDLKRRELTIRQLVSYMEQSIVDLLASYRINAYARAEAPGVYVGEKKIASLGLRLKQHCTYHGLSINIDMDLTPFEAIDPCGYQGMQVTQTKALALPLTLETCSTELLQHLETHLKTPLVLKSEV